MITHTLGKLKKAIFEEKKVDFQAEQTRVSEMYQRCEEEQVRFFFDMLRNMLQLVRDGFIAVIHGYLLFWSHIGERSLACAKYFLESRVRYYTYTSDAPTIPEIFS